MSGPPLRTPGGKSLGSVAFLVCVALGAVGLVVAAAGPWRLGVLGVGASVLLACLCRIVLPERMSGLLRVRRKAPDVLWMAALGLGIVVLATLVPEI